MEVEKSPRLKPTKFQQDQEMSGLKTKRPETRQPPIIMINGEEQELQVNQNGSMRENSDSDSEGDSDYEEDSSDELI